MRRSLRLVAALTVILGHHPATPLMTRAFFAVQRGGPQARHCHDDTTSSSSTYLSMASSSSSSDSSENVRVMVNGMPGPMAVAAAEACLRKGLKLNPFAMTGPEIEPSTITVTDAVTGNSGDVRLIPSTDTNEIISCLQGLKEVGGETTRLLAIDFTHPSAVNANARFYVQHDVPFVMGTTGGNREELLQDVQGHACVIAPNMGKQIVAMQLALENLARDYPGCFEGYKLDMVESHQKTKADTSGTAKAVIDSIQTLTNNKPPFSIEDDIKMIRNDDDAVAFGVPQHAMKGHAFHTYTLTSPDGSVQFELKHNVAGRTIYAEGTADAVKFLAKKLAQGGESKVYNMINVLEEGALE
jgi:4-hydroxy-tetrahydrodipicolinate reductase